MRHRWRIEHPPGPADVVYDTFADPERDHGTVVSQLPGTRRAEWFIRGAEYEHERILDLLEGCGWFNANIDEVITLITTEQS